MAAKQCDILLFEILIIHFNIIIDIHQCNCCKITAFTAVHSRHSMRCVLSIEYQQLSIYKYNAVIGFGFNSSKLTISC